jgi:S-DNA-T family DNA segregation ATPase FtsK/SpoIIIE
MDSIGISGMSLATLGLCAYMLPVGMNPNTAKLTIVGGIVTTLYGYFSERKTKLDKLFLNCGLLINTGNVKLIPKKIRKIPQPDGHDMILTLPPGMCLDDFRKKQINIAQALNANVRFDFNNGQIIMFVRHTKLGTDYSFQHVPTDSPLKVCFAHDIDGPYIFDIESAIHTIVAGATGFGKSVLLRSLITALVLKQSPDLKLHLVDFQRVELGIFKRSSQVTYYSTPEEFERLLDSLAKESDRRLSMFESINVVNIKSWNQKNPKNKLPYNLVIVDEFAALQGEKQIMLKLTKRLAQDRKCGQHYILCTQRPSVEIISGDIKTNAPTRISLKMATNTDSTVILDQTGAEDLKCKGRALIKLDSLHEVQVMYLSEDEAMEKIQHTFKPDQKKVKGRGVI